MLVMACKLPFRQFGCRKDDIGRINLHMDLMSNAPSDIVEQLMLWGIYSFDDCQYDAEREVLRLSASTTFYEKGA